MAKWRYKEGVDSERFEKKGKMRSRSKKSRKKNEVSNFILEEEKWSNSSENFRARVVEVHKRYVFVSVEPEIGAIDTADVWLGRVARKYLTEDRVERNFVAVGDRVLCRPALDTEKETETDIPQCIVLHLSPRSTRISRVDPGSAEREHVLATNVDQMLIVSSYFSPRVKWGLIDRYLVLAEVEGVKPVLILNKVDLLEDKNETHPEVAQDFREKTDYYQDLGYTTVVIQASDPDEDSVKNLKKILKDKISLFSGHSGVGKSSVINLFDPEIVQEVEENSDIFYKGRHTTTFASFIKLGIGGYVIDTPGIRSFVIQSLDPPTLSFGFRDFREYIGKCEFRACRHMDEPGCRIAKAVSEGNIPEWRYRNYVGILSGHSGREGRGGLE